MQRYGKIVNGVIDLVVESSAQPSAELGDWRLCGDAGPGWLYDGVIASPPPGPGRKEAVLSRLAEIDAISDKPRTRRELALSKNATKVWLQTLDDEATALRTELAGVVNGRAQN